MNTCSTCRHWRTGVPDRPPGTGVCGLISEGGPSGTHLARVQSWSEADDDPTLLTRSTFGCTEHEPPDDAA